MFEPVVLHSDPSSLLAMIHAIDSIALSSNNQNMYLRMMVSDPMSLDDLNQLVDIDVNSQSTVQESPQTQGSTWIVPHLPAPNRPQKRTTATLHFSLEAVGGPDVYRFKTVENY